MYGVKSSNFFRKAPPHPSLFGRCQLASMRYFLHQLKSMAAQRAGPKRARTHPHRRGAAFGREAKSFNSFAVSIKYGLYAVRIELQYVSIYA